MTDPRRTLAILAVLASAGCLDVPEPRRDDGLEGAGGEGEGEGPAEGEGEGEGPAEGEGEGPAEGEGEGEGEEPGLALVPVADIPFEGLTITGAEVTADGLSVAVFVRSTQVVFLPLDAPDPDNPSLTIRAPGSVFRDFALSPVLPLAVTLDTSTGTTLHAWATDGAEPELLGSLGSVGGLSPIRFNAAGDTVVVVQDGDAVAVRATGAIGEAWRDGDYPKHPDQQALFVGPDDLLVVTENPATSRLRIMGTDESGPSGDPPAQWRALNVGDQPCASVTCLASASGESLLAVCCSDGAVRLYDPLVWGEPEVFRGVLRPLDAATLSEDGRFLAALEGDKAVVWDRETGAQASVAAGAGPRHYAPRLSLRHGLLALDRDERVVVFRVEVR